MCVWGGGGGEKKREDMLQKFKDFDQVGWSFLPSHFAGQISHLLSTHNAYTQL